MAFRVNDQDLSIPKNVRTYGGTAVNVTAGVILCGTSGAVLPTVACQRAIIKLVTSGVCWFASSALVNSGVGYVILGDPGTGADGTILDLPIRNLNQLYAKMQTVSGMLSFVAY